MSTNTVTAYKGFDSDMKCRGFQYEVGKTYTHDGPVEMCASGFHACLEPFDVWGYYGPVDARFAEVEMTDPASERGNRDSKAVTATIKVVAELSMPALIGRAVDRLIEMTKEKGDDPSGDYAKIGSSGDYAQIGSSGHSAKIDASGTNSVIASAGVATRAKGAGGTWISLAEYDGGACVGFATGCCGHGGVPADTWLVAKGGKLVPEAAS